MVGLFDIHGLITVVLESIKTEVISEVNFTKRLSMGNITDEKVAATTMTRRDIT